MKSLILVVFDRRKRNGFEFEVHYKSGRIKTYTLDNLPNTVRKFVDTAPHTIKLYGKNNYLKYHEADAFKKLLLTH